MEIDWYSGISIDASVDDYSPSRNNIRYARQRKGGKSELNTPK